MNIFTSPQITVNFILLVSSALAMIYGIYLFFKPRKAMYAQLITCSMACFMLYHLFNTVCLICRGYVSEGFGSGIFGFIGAFMFLFSASYGQMDGLVDDHTEKMRRYRLLALLAPLCIAVIYIPIFIVSSDNDVKVIMGIKFLFMALVSYYALKHSIIRDEELGIIQCVKPYNITVLVLCVLYAAAFAAGVLGYEIATVVFAGSICAVYLSMIPVLKRGVAKWTI